MKRNKDISLDKLQNELDNEGIVLLKDFTTSVTEFLNLSQMLGEVLPRSSVYAEKGNSKVLKYVGHVKFADELPEEKRLPTQTNGPLPFHTARSFSRLRPKYFAMYMHNQGWIKTVEDLNGESLFIKFKDVLIDYKKYYPEEYKKDISLLRNTNILRKPWYVKEATNEPIIQENEGVLNVRYWEGMVNSIEKMVNEINNGKEYLEVIKKFDYIMRTSKSAIEIQLNTNDVIIINNQNVAHARKGFLSKKENKLNPREIYTTWIV